MATSVAAATAASRSCSVPATGTWAARQSETLQNLVTRHVRDPALAEIMSADSFAPTSLERGVRNWEHGHIVAALDVLIAYQRDRKARSTMHVLGARAGYGKRFIKDPRTRLVELMKAWLRQQAANANVSEEELRSMVGLCRGVLNHPHLFPARNSRSFLKTMAEVYEHLVWNLREVLEKERTCAELAQRALSLSRNLLSDVVAFLLLGPTHLRQTDRLPSMEVVALWQSLPSELLPLRGRADEGLQRVMGDAWKTHCGALVAALVSTPWCVRLFDGAGAQEEASLVAHGYSADEHSEKLLALLEEVRSDFEQKRWGVSGLAGALRKPGASQAWQNYLDAVQAPLLVQSSTSETKPAEVFGHRMNGISALALQHSLHARNEQLVAKTKAAHF